MIMIQFFAHCATINTHTCPLFEHVCGRVSLGGFNAYRLQQENTQVES